MNETQHGPAVLQSEPMATNGMPDDHIDNVVIFPKRGGSTPVEQFDIARGAKATAILAAITRKYGPLPITVDDIEASRTDRPFIAYQPITNTWSVSVDHPDHGGGHARTGERR